ncbi:MAG TPA: hypothetical protein VEH86_07795 [Candidatus Acidoferrum sp.]|nr:hypothetical protein [Candidatus Acidoferrum sp.]
MGASVQLTRQNIIHGRRYINKDLSERSSEYDRTSSVGLSSFFIRKMGDIKAKLRHKARTINLELEFIPLSAAARNRIRNPDTPHIKPPNVPLLPMRENSAKYERIKGIPHPIDTPKNRDDAEAPTGLPATTTRDKVEAIPINIQIEKKRRVERTRMPAPNRALRAIPAKNTPTTTASSALDSPRCDAKSGKRVYNKLYQTKVSMVRTKTERNTLR